LVDKLRKKNHTLEDELDEIDEMLDTRDESIKKLKDKII